MSVCGYLGINGPSVADESVEEMILELTEPRPRTRGLPVECQAEVYESVAAYDPVLAWHCRLDGSTGSKIKNDDS